MARRIKKPKPPPLAVPDRIVYIILIGGGFAMMLGSVVLYLHLLDRIAGTDADTRLWKNTAEMWIMPLMLALYMPALIGAIWHPMPIFGNKRVKYGLYPYHDYAPIFSRTRPLKTARPEIWAKKRRQTIALLLVMLIGIFLCLPGLCPRYTLQADGSIREYNVRNQCVETHWPTDMTELQITAWHGMHTRGPEFYSLRIDITAEDGESYRFGFNRDYDAAALQAMLDFRRTMERLHVPVVIQADDWDTHLSVKELLPLIARDQRMSAEETALLYELFDGA